MDSHFVALWLGFFLGIFFATIWRREQAPALEEKDQQEDWHGGVN